MHIYTHYTRKFLAFVFTCFHFNPLREQVVPMQVPMQATTFAIMRGCTYIGQPNVHVEVSGLDVFQ
jgi:hypothetical protein